MRIRRFRSFICIALSILMAVTGLTYADTANTDTAKCPDIAGHKYEAQLREWVDNGFIKGDPNGNFRPDSTITRAEFMALVNRSFGFTEAEEINYTDVPKDKWFYKDAAIAVKAGYMQGSGGRLTPLDPISRQEFATVLVRLTGSAASADDKTIAGLSDGGSIPEWSRAAVSTSVGKGYFKDFADAEFRPTEKISRTEVVVVLDRAYRSMYKAVYSRKGAYGPESGIQTLDGSAVIIAQEVTLRNTVVNGDLILRESIGDGNVYLDNVVVKGTTIVKGGGKNSIVIRNSTLGKVIVRREGDVVRIIATGSTTVGEVDVQSGVTLQEEFLTGDGFGDVVIPDDIFAGATVVFEGDFDDIQVNSSNININIESGTVGNLTLTQEAAGTTVNLSQQASVNTLNLNAAVNITGQGTIQTANVNAQGVTIEQTPQNTVTAPGVTLGTTPGPAQPPAPPTPPGGGGSGSGGGGDRDDNDGQDYIAVTGVSLDHESINLTVGDAAFTLKATVSPANASDKRVTWSSDNTGAATVNNGSVKPVAAGTAVITATTVDGGKKDSCIVNVLMKVEEGKPVVFENGTSIKGLPAGAKISASEVEVKEEEGIEAAGAAMKFIFEGTMPSAGVTLRLPTTSNDAGLSYYNEARGKWELQEGSKIVSEGGQSFVEATVRHFSIYGPIIKSARLVADSITGIQAPKKDDKLLKLPAVPDGFTIAIKSSSKQGVIALDGTIIPPAVDTTVAIVLEATRISDGTKAETGAINVVVPAGTQTIPVQGISVSPAKMTLTEGGAPGTITATIIPADATNKKVTWSSDEPDVASVDNGIVTPVKSGKAIITATAADGGFKAFCEVTVVKPIPDTYYLDIFSAPHNGGTVTKYVYNESTGELTVTDAVYFKAGSKLSLEAKEAVGYDFVNWTDATGEVSTKNPYGFIMKAEHTILTANFKPEAKASTYSFDFDIPEGITAGQETSIDVTFATDIPGDYGYNNVRFRFQKLSGPGDAIFTATDSAGNSYLATNEGYWGPGGGFDIPASYSATTPWEITFSEVGSYTFEVSLVYASDNAVVAGITETVTVNVPAKRYTGAEALAYVVPENFNTHNGMDYRGLNVGFRLVGLVMSQLEKIEVSLYKGDGKLVTNTAKMAEMNNLGDGVIQHSTPFIITQGEYIENYWVLGTCNWTKGSKPDKAEIKLTDKSGNIYIVENGSLSEATALFEELFTGGIAAQDFGIVNGAGSAGAKLTGNKVFGDVKVLTVQWYDYAGNLLLTGDLRLEKCDLTLDIISMPFIPNFDYEKDGYWDVVWEADGMAGEPVRVVFSVEFKNGIKAAAENTRTAAGWSELADTSWYSGTGDTFDVNTAAQLAGLAKLVNEGNNLKGKTIRLTNNINLAGKQWIPAGTAEHKFEGTIEGNGYTISNLKGTNGLIAFAGRGSAVRNVIVDAAVIKGDSGVAAVVGDGMVVTITNCEVTAASIKGDKYIGSVLGHNGYGDISGCTVSNSAIEGTDRTVGGLVGYYGEGSHTISDCTVTGTNVSGHFRTGGLVGLLQYGNKVNNCTVTGGTVTSRPYNGVDAGLAGLIIKTGGFIGDVFTTRADVIITNCSTTAQLGGAPGLYHDSVGPFIGNVDDGDKGVLKVKGCSENGNAVDYTMVSTGAELKREMEDATVSAICFSEDIELDGTLVISREIKIDGLGHSVDKAVNIASNGVTLRNLKGTVVDRASHGLPGIGGGNAFYVNGKNILLENVSADGTGVTDPTCRAVIGHTGSKFTVRNSSFKHVTTGIFAHSGNTEPAARQVFLTATGNTFEDVLAGIGGTEKTELIATGNTFESIKEGGEGIGLGVGVLVPGDYNGYDADYLKNGCSNVFKYPSGNTVRDYRPLVKDVTAANLISKINEAMDYSVIFVPAGEYDLTGGVVTNKNITIIGDTEGEEDTTQTIIDTTTQGTYGAIQATNGHRLVLKNLTFKTVDPADRDARNGHYVAATSPHTGETEIIIDNCIMNGYYTTVYLNNVNTNNNKLAITNSIIKNSDWAYSIDNITLGAQDIKPENLLFSGNDDRSDNGGREIFESAKVLLTWPDGSSKGYFSTISEAVAKAADNDTINVAAGKYIENVSVNKKVSLVGAGADKTRIVAVNANGTPLTFNTNGATVKGFTITHEYTPEEIAAWNFNNSGVIFGQGKSGNTLENCTVTLNRNGIYLNNCQNNTIRNNIITSNRTGINTTNNIDGTAITGNTISENWTIGLVHYSLGHATDFSTVTVSGNTFDANWYTEILIKDSISAGALDVTGNTFTDDPVTYTTSSDTSINEPSYENQIPAVPGINGPDGRPDKEMPTLRIYNSPTASLNYDKVKTLCLGINEPYKTFEAALNDAEAGDIIEFIGTFGSSGTNINYEVTKPVRIIGHAGNKIYGFFTVKADNTTLEGLNIEVSAGSAIIALQSANISILNNVLLGTNSASKGINQRAQAAPGSVNITGNDISNFDIGISIDQSKIVPGAIDNNITGNTVSYTRKGIIVGSESKATVTNNTVQYASAVGIEISSKFSDNVINGNVYNNNGIDQVMAGD